MVTRVVLVAPTLISFSEINECEIFHSTSLPPPPNPLQLSTGLGYCSTSDDLGKHLIA